MKNINIRKMAVTLATLQALSMTGCKSNDVDIIDHNNIIQMISFSDTVTDSRGIKQPKKVDLFYTDYILIPSDRNTYDINEGARIYNKNGKDIGEITQYLRLTALKTNGYYTLVLIDDKEYYVESIKLREVPNLTTSDYKIINDNKEVICDDNIILYDARGRFITYIWGNEEATAIAIASIKKFFNNNPHSIIKTVEFDLFDDYTYSVFQEELSK